MYGFGLVRQTFGADLIAALKCRVCCTVSCIMPFQNELIILLIASVMLAMGLSIRPGELRSTFVGKPFFQSMAINIVLLPLIAALLSTYLSTAAATTLLIAAACGAGTTTPLFTANVKGDVTLATAVVIGTGFACLITLPVTLWLFSIGGDGTVAVATSAFRLLLLLQILPLLLGFAIQSLHPMLADKLSVGLKVFGNALLLGLIIGFAVVKGDEFFGLPWGDLLAMFVFILGSFVVPAAVFKEARSAQVFSTATRNLNLGLLIVIDVLKDENLLTYTLVYCALMYAIWPVATFCLRRVAETK
jgi:predicted Na+-dependent transporter